MKYRMTAIACVGLALACGDSASPGACQEWDASVREVVSSVEGALPSGVEGRPFAEEYQFVAESLELSEELAACVEQGHLVIEAAAPEEARPATDLAYLDQLEFGVRSRDAVRVMEGLGWSCKAAPPPAGFEEKAQACSGTYAKGKAEVKLGFRSARLVRASLAVQDIPKRIEDIVAKTDADVFSARTALIEKVVGDLETRFVDLTKTKDQVENGGIRMAWMGSDGSRRVQVVFSQRGPSLGFAIEDDAVAREIAEAAAKKTERKAESYFE